MEGLDGGERARPPERDDATSIELLERHYGGGDGALGELIARHRDWLWRYVRRHMGSDLRAFEDSEDVVQDVLHKLFTRGPAFIPRDEDQLRRLLATIVINRLRDRHDWIHTAKRDRQREAGGAVSVLSRIGPVERSEASPSRIVAREEEVALLELAMELIDPEDAVVLRLRNWESLEFAEIARRLGLEPDAARMRFNRSVRRLGAMTLRLQEGRLGDLAPDLDLDAGSR